ncbi:MAG: hypothetical protein HYT73_04040 [Candidatus Aenigmarchaeota archaeon]|nr:hypothetical protein [Candidatus Aenigmarchaeota archaeon]
MSEIIFKGKHESAWITISTDEYESMLATIETLSNPDAMKKIKKGEKERLEGKLKSLEHIKKELDI